MIHRRAHDGQPQGHGHALLEAVDLDGDVALVVVHGHHGVELPAQGTDEDGIGGEGAAGVDSSPLRRLHRRADGRDLLVADQSTVAAVRVQRRHCQAGPLHAPGPQPLSGDLDGLQHPFGGDVRGHLPQGQVAGDVHHAQRPTGQHGRAATCPRQLGQDLRVADEIVAAEAHGLLVQRRRGDGLHAARQRQLRGPHDGLHRRPPRLGAQGSRPHPAPVHVVQVEEVHLWRSEACLRHIGQNTEIHGDPQQLPRPFQHAKVAHHQRAAALVDAIIAQGLDDDLRPHPGGIAHGDGHDGPIVCLWHGDLSKEPRIQDYGAGEMQRRPTSWLR